MRCAVTSCADTFLKVFYTYFLNLYFELAFLINILVTLLAKDQNAFW